MTSINPGEEKIYEWKADYAGVWMYHCGTSPALHHIANGMYGMVIVEPSGGPAARSTTSSRSSRASGTSARRARPPSLTKAAAAAPAPDFVVFNGVANQYLDNPIEVGTGERVRVFVLERRPEHRQLVPRRRHDLRHRDQGRRPAASRQRRQLRLPGRRPVAGAGRDRRVQDARGRPLPDGHPRLQLRRPRRAGPLPGRRRRSR